MYLRLKRLADDLRCHIKDVELLELMRDHWKNPEGEVDLNEAANIEAYFLSSLRNAFESRTRNIVHDAYVMPLLCLCYAA